MLRYYQGGEVQHLFTEQFYQMMKKTGVCIIRVVEKLDAGPIIQKKKKN